MRICLFIGAINGAIAVSLGAVEAHALGPATSDTARAMFDTAVRYHLTHSLALLVLVAIAPHLQGTRSWRLIQVSGAAFIGGIALFCGGLYALSGLGMPIGARLAPVGGTLLIVGWLALAIAALSSRSEEQRPFQ
jgi:uncharacterized membrane protein YgdD (TMEM256/DUF423 family)